MMLDLFCGLGGASAAMRERGWDVVGVDNDPGFSPDVVADLAAWSWSGVRPDLVWCSPPCTEFSRETMPWCRTGEAPDMTLVEASRRIIAETRPTWWAIENVKGAIPYFGDGWRSFGPFFLWTNLPSFRANVSDRRFKESMSSTARAERARVPYAISAAVADAVEGSLFSVRL